MCLDKYFMFGRKTSKMKSFVIVSELIFKRSSNKNVFKSKLLKFFIKIILKLNHILYWKHRFSTPSNVRTRKSQLQFHFVNKN